jgi:tetratricopeptide (TPR) repeat protein
MNDTVRLGLILKKIVILLNKGQYTVALDHLKEVESMLNLLLKNKRVLLYMEEEYKLLTFYYQLYLDLLSEYYYLIKSYGESTKCILEMFRYGGIYNISSRIKAFNRLINIIEDNSRHIPAFPAQSLRPGFQRRTVEHARIANLNRYITFTLNERRNFIFMIDCSEDSIDHIDCIQSTFKNVLNI